jgi:hypothetical protein
MTDCPPGLAHFLCSAKAATYAAQGDDASVTPVLPDSRQLEYRDGTFLYRDIYVGIRRFVGQEVVYLNDRAVWSMSYAGGLAQGVSQGAARPVYTFLRRALLTPSPEFPVRGPAELAAEGLHYACNCEGSLAWFQGSERITQDGALLYTLRFAGGLLQ